MALLQMVAVLKVMAGWKSTLVLTPGQSAICLVHLVTKFKYTYFPPCSCPADHNQGFSPVESGKARHDQTGSYGYDLQAVTHSLLKMAHVVA